METSSEPASTTPLQQPAKNKSGLRAGIFAVILVVLIVAAGSFYFFSHKVVNISIVPKPVAVQIASPLDTLKVIDIPTTVSAAQYQLYLKRNIDASMLDGYKQSGSVGINIDDQGEITVAFTPIPNINIGTAPLLAFTSIKNSKGQEILDASSSFETDPFFQTLGSITGNSQPIPYISGTRSPNLIAGTSLDDISSVKGELIFNLPADMKIVTFTPADVGKVVVTPYGTTTLKSFITSSSTDPDSDAESSSTIVINYAGFKERIASLSAYDENGKPIDCSTDYTLGSSGYDNSVYTLSDCGDAATVTFAEAGSEVKAELPFDTSLSASTSLPANVSINKQNSSASNVSAEDKAAIIESQVNFFTVLSSNSASQIRTYMEKQFSQSGDSDDAAKLEKSSDADILDQASTLISFGYPDVKDVAELRGLLNSPTTMWQEINDNGTTTVQITLTQDGGNNTITVTKINGQWVG